MVTKITQRWMTLAGALVMGGTLLLGAGALQAEEGAATQPSAKAHRERGERGEQGKRGDGEHGKRGDGQLVKIIEELGLSEQQKPQVKQILVDFRTQMKTWRDAHQAEIDKLKAQAKAAHESEDKTQMQALRQQREALMQDAPKLTDLRAKLNTVLSPEQQKTLDEKMASLRGEFAQKHPQAAKGLKERGQKAKAKEGEAAH